MSDEADTHHNAWISALSRPDKKHLGRWQVDWSWQCKIGEHIKDEEQQAEVYATI